MCKENTAENIWPHKENGIRRIRTNQEFTELNREPDIISEIIKGRLQLL